MTACGSKDGDTHITEVIEIIKYPFVTVTVPKNSCVEVLEGIWAENIRGEVFDVYFNDSCADVQGEYCDNVLPSYPESGSVDSRHHEGSGTICWAGDIRVSGSLESDDSITVRVEDFR